ncbi:methyltransferase domain-containing protein [Sphingorhabdus sp. Alg239-R122]|uniref:methyltransferase domain-containing protein n=1 Tax=Sphingorhabdus sp. Alg239-R122 TaxID=2305989 RepID=UPI0013D9ED5E|nr:methyltransferase domain-containing protein [Sphingorhabdus sp. Alg239-R122]
MVQTVSDSSARPADIFDRKRRQLARDRATRSDASHEFLHAHMAEEMLERLQWVKRDFNDVLVIGSAPGQLISGLKAQGMALTYADSSAACCARHEGVHCEEDRLPFEAHSFDLIISNGVLDSVNDLPGALIQMQHILRPDGLFLAAFVGAGSLPQLKAAMMAADSAKNSETMAAHIHPQIDVRAAGDLLTRAGFTMPVADGERLTVRYSDLPSLVRDLRGMGAHNVLASKPPYIGKQGLLAAANHFAESADNDGKTSEIFELIYLSGWAPDASQPKPARRGSGKVSLASTLKPTGRQ